ncbi:MAG: lyase family protein [Sedimentitalea sp.]
MAASVFESPLFAQLFPTGDVGRLFTDSAEIRAMMLVEGALAKVQGGQGIIPELSAAAISRAAMEIQIDPGALAEATGQNGVCVPAFVAAFRTEMSAPEHAQFLHWGTTSQDIIDTGLMLRLRQALALFERDLRALLTRLGTLATAHADTVMAARTFGQHATVTSFGAVVAGWGAPLLSCLQGLEGLRAQHLIVSLSGAAGTASALGENADRTRAELADALGLADPGRCWHTDRAPVLALLDWMVQLSQALGKMGADLSDLAQTGINEVAFGGAGASSTLPQKQNPVGPNTLEALARITAAQRAMIPGVHRHQRDGAAWFGEWMVVPQVVLGCASALCIADKTVAGLTPLPDQMRAALTGQDLIHAEAISFALAAHMTRPEAQTAVKAMCREAMQTGASLGDLLARDYPDLDSAGLVDPDRQMGNAPATARAFGAAVRHVS